MRKATLQVHACRQVGAELLGGGIDAGLHVDDVKAVLLVGGDEHRALPLIAAGIAQRLIGPSHARHIAHAHDLFSSATHHGIAHFIQRLITTRGLQAEAARAGVYEAGGDVGIAALQRLHHTGGVDVCRGQATAIELHAQLSSRKRPDF